MNIKIDLTNTEEALNPFNKNIISKSLDNYLTSSLINNPLNKLTLTIIGDASLKDIIHNYYKNKYLEFKRLDKLDDYVRLILFFVGFIAILISYQFTNFLNEILLIPGWVLIYEVIYDFLFNNLKRKKKTKVYKALSSCEIICKIM